MLGVLSYLFTLFLQRKPNCSKFEWFWRVWTVRRDEENIFVTSCLIYVTFLSITHTESDLPRIRSLFHNFLWLAVWITVLRAGEEKNYVKKEHSIKAFLLIVWSTKTQLQFAALFEVRRDACAWLVSAEHLQKESKGVENFAIPTTYNLASLTEIGWNNFRQKGTS